MAKLREAQKAMTRRLLLEAGLHLFTTKGYAGTTVDEIATAAGTTRVTFYAYFPTRAELMRTLIEERLDGRFHAESDLVTVVADGTPAAIGAWMRQSFASWAEKRPILRIGRDAAAIEPDLRALVERWFGEGVRAIEDGLERAGRFAPEVRRFRGVLAMAELDHVARNGADADWQISDETMLAELIASWVRLLGA
ncbi:TetR/AcrR family transcriptional regulator [Actinoplanes sp. NPDC051851]|uniref:TetR/AcrR family transcriptional regulator n=1 Tax=Actinoplanes sp. NPDC051851 TaxID=3154753 RepID=UPI00344514C5